MRNRRRALLVVMVLGILPACGHSRTSRTAAARTRRKPAPAATSSPTAASVTSTTRDPAAVRPPTTAAPPFKAVPARVRVAVAQIWHTPTLARASDRLALTAPVDIRGWLAPMSTKQREDLTGRVDTSALLGDQVLVTGEDGSWAHVVVLDQPNPADPRGYPGWMPRAQLTFAPAPPSATGTDATVTSLTTWLLEPTDGHRVMEVSIGTRLPVHSASTDSTTVDVDTPDGAVERLTRADVSVTPAGTPALAPGTNDVVRVARQFEGLPYLWGGVSGFGVDCSGLTWIDYRLHGITIPRDASAQAVAGTPISNIALQPGDIVFFANSAGVVHHNGLVVGDNLMLHASHTGTPVREARLDQPPYAGQIAAARRYLG